MLSEYAQKNIGLDELLLKHPVATYFVRARGDSMQDGGIYCGDLLVVDRDAKPKNGDIVIAAINNQLTCKYLDTRKSQLISADPQYPPIKINLNDSSILEGVVSSSIRNYHFPSTN